MEQPRLKLVGSGLIPVPELLTCVLCLSYLKGHTWEIKQFLLQLEILLKNSVSGTPLALGFLICERLCILKMGL